MNFMHEQHHHHSSAVVPPPDDTPDDSGGGASAITQKEHMFDKVVTPSDVGKLNRLVIPKQHAEKYFPLDSSSNEKGLLLNFEDRNGKPWRFRYSYWNSSQSYVMTKGWSRFVKEKRLDAGDIVSFQRGAHDHTRLFIDWGRRPEAPPPPSDLHPSFRSNNQLYPWSTTPLFLQRDHHYSSQYGLLPAHHHHQPHHAYHHHHHHHPYAYTSSTVVNGSPLSPTVFLRPGGGGAGGFGPAQVQRGVVFESVPVVQGKAAAKRLRLFGVNMECPISEPDNNDDPRDYILSSTTIHQPQYSTVLMAPILPPFDSSSSSPSSSVNPCLQLRPNSYYSQVEDDDEDDDGYDDGKGKGSMSLDLDI